MSELPPPDALPLVKEFLPALTGAQLEQLGRLTALVRAWNERVNLVSRKDVEHLEEHHLLHSLCAARVVRFAAGAHVADVGTGGGFPGLPLAILNPLAKFTLIDSIAKKARAVEDVVAALELKNVRVITTRVEQVRDRFDYVLGRAVAALPAFLGWTAPLLRPGAKGDIANGVLYFKGTMWREELAGSRAQPTTIWDLHELVPRPYFAEKFLLHFAAPVKL
jgi:16S rRNA (guanine527-N7)-methyltransferase